MALFDPPPPLESHVFFEWPLKGKAYDSIVYCSFHSKLEQLTFLCQLIQWDEDLTETREISLEKLFQSLKLEKVKLVETRQYWTRVVRMPGWYFGTTSSWNKIKHWNIINCPFRDYDLVFNMFFLYWSVNCLVNYHNPTLKYLVDFFHSWSLCWNETKVNVCREPNVYNNKRVSHVYALLTLYSMRAQNTSRGPNVARVSFFLACKAQNFIHSACLLEFWPSDMAKKNLPAWDLSCASLL